MRRRPVVAHLSEELANRIRQRIRQLERLDAPPSSAVTPAADILGELRGLYWVLDQGGFRRAA